MSAVIRPRFYLLVTFALVAFVVVGFSQSYYLKLFSGLPPLTTVLHLHVVVFTAWLGLFIAQAAGRLRHLVADDRVLGVLPMSHVYGLSSVCLGSLLAGASIHMQPRFTPAALRRALEDEGLTLCQGVPAMYSKYLE